MKAEEVIALLQTRLPLFTESFSDVVTTSSVSNPSAGVGRASTLR